MYLTSSSFKVPKAGSKMLLYNTSMFMKTFEF